MSKRSVLCLSIVLLLLLLFSSKVVLADSAVSRAEVLGVSDTVRSALQIPPTVEGPGLILPDSPLFFLDKLKQNIRLFLAFTPAAKAKVYDKIAGERLAELRFELSKNNLDAAKIALEGVSDNFTKAAGEVGLAKLAGVNVENLAKTINDDIKNNQQILDALDTQVKGGLKDRVSAVQKSLLKSKIDVEDALSQKDLENEVKDDLDRVVQQKVGDASDLTKETETQLLELQKEASSAAQKSISRRQEALNKAIEKKNDVLSKVEQKLLQKEQEKQSRLLEIQSQAIQQVREVVSKAQEAALKFQQVQQTVNKIRNEAVSVSTNSDDSSNAKSQTPKSVSSGVKK